MKSTVSMRRLMLVAFVATVSFVVAQPASAIDPRGNLTGVWKDRFGNKFLITQRAGTKKVNVKYFEDAGNLIWRSAAGEAKREGSEWVLATTLRLKNGKTRPRRGRVVVGEGVIVWPAGNRWTLLENQDTRVENLEQQLADAEQRSKNLVRDLNQSNSKSQQELDALSQKHKDLEALTGVLLLHAMTEEQRHRCGSCVADANHAAEDAGVSNDAPVALFPESYTVPLTISPNDSRQ